MVTLRKVFERDNYAIISNIIQRKETPITSQEIDTLEDNLDKLPSILGNTEWTITGGIAAQINHGSWYRNPGNVNISVHEDTLFEIAEHVHTKAGYRLLSRHWQARILPGIKRETYEVPRWNEQSLARAYPNLRFIRFEKETPVQNRSFLDFIDVHVYRVVQHRYQYSPKFNHDTVESLDGNKESPAILLTYAEQNTSYQTRSGTVLQVRGLEYMHKVKHWLIKEERDKTGIHAFDLAKLEEARQYRAIPSI